MKGFVQEPFQDGPFNWRYARQCLANDTDCVHDVRNKTLQDMIMGPSVQPCAHVIVPTLLCITMDDERTRMLMILWRQWFADEYERSAYMCVAQFREHFMHACAFCNARLRHRTYEEPYQLAIRFIMGYSCAFSPAAGIQLTAHLEILFSVLCDKCCTVPRAALMMVTELDYPVIAHAITSTAFYQRANMTRFTHYARHSFQEALVQVLLWRCTLINEQRRSFMRTVMQIPALGLIRCCACLEYTEHAHLCQHCYSCYFCTACNSNYNQLVMHVSACFCVIKQHIFHVQCAMYVNQKSGRYECIPVTELIPLTRPHVPKKKGRR